MPRYVAKPIIVTAVQYNGHVNEWPESFRLAVRGHRAGGIIEVMTGDGVRQCKHGDWIVAGPDGTFTRQSAATFETWFAEHQPIEETKAPTPTPAARAATRSKVHG
jgi:hypothetical protein